MKFKSYSFLILLDNSLSKNISCIAFIIIMFYFDIKLLIRNNSFTTTTTTNNNNKNNNNAPLSDHNIY
jgi:hypothetical protein